jgi:GTPase SAR1 family protein
LSRKLYKIALAGLSFAGKTSIIKRLITGQYIPTEPTKGFDTELYEQGNVRFQVVDLGGQDVFIHTLWKAFLPQADVMIYVIDAADHKNFIKARDVLHFSIGWNPDMPVLVILANKQDLPSAANDNETLEILNIPTIISENNFKQFRVFGTSAKTGLGIEDAFSWLAQELTDQDNIITINLKSSFLFKKEISAFAGPGLGIELANANFTGTDDLIIAGVSIEDFMNQMNDSAIHAMELEDTIGKKYRLVKVEDHRLTCFLLVEATDDSIVVRAIGEELLYQASQKLDSNQRITEESFREMVKIFVDKTILEKLTPSPDHLQEDISSIVSKDAIEKTVIENNQKHIKSNSQREDVTFFTKMSVLDRIRVLEDK